MADLMTRILLNDKQFSDTLDKSKRQVNGFEKVGGVATGMITKMAGAFGIAATATEAFRKVIDSTQGNTDRFNSVMEQARGPDGQCDRSGRGKVSAGNIHARRRGVLRLSG